MLSDTHVPGALIWILFDRGEAEFKLSHLRKNFCQFCAQRNSIWPIGNHLSWVEEKLKRYIIVHVFQEYLSLCGRHVRMQQALMLFTRFWLTPDPMSPALPYLCDDRICVMSYKWLILVRNKVLMAYSWDVTEYWRDFVVLLSYE